MSNSPDPALSSPVVPPASSVNSSPLKWDSRMTVFAISSLISAVVGMVGGIGTSALLMWTSLVRLEERISSIPKVNESDLRQQIATVQERLSAIPKVDESEIRQEIVSLQERVHVLEQAKIDVTALNNINTNNVNGINSLVSKVETLQQNSQSQHVRLNNAEESVRNLQAKVSALCENSAKLSAHVELLSESPKSLVELRERVAKLEAKQ